jgi:hypothetical protein
MQALRLVNGIIAYALSYGRKGTRTDAICLPDSFRRYYHPHKFFGGALSHFIDNDIQIHT